MTRRNLFLRTIGAALAAMLPRKRTGEIKAEIKPIAVRAVPYRKVWRVTYEYVDCEKVEYVAELEPEKLLQAKRCELGTELAAKQITDSMRHFGGRS